MSEHIFPTTVVGSYPKPKWLLKEKARFDKGELSADEMEELYRKAVQEVVKEHEEAGVDYLWDGEMRRTEMVEYFAERIKGFKLYDLVRVWGNAYFRKPAVYEKVEYIDPMLVDEFKYLRSITKNEIKVPITGPYTIADWSFNEHYDTKREFVLDLAEIIHKEVKALEAAGANFIQIDEPALSTHPSEVGLVKESTEIVTKGLKTKTHMHICYGDFSLIYPQILDFSVDGFDLEFANRKYRSLEIFKDPVFTKEIGYGCIDVHSKNIESVEEVKEGIRKGMEVFDPKKMFIDPDCGLKMIPRETAFSKLKVMCQAAREMREA
jgi:5-methyltetrahydropteroyltriglutamate--homocysteine methyltransferase